MYSIRIIGDPVLRKKSETISEFNSDLNETVQQLTETMHIEDGIGLAAPQVGILKRIIVIDISPLEKEEHPRAFINPEIIENDGESTVEEGCLSIPNVREKITRPEKITLLYNDKDGSQISEEYDGWLARVLQHEIDHLNGVLFVDYLSPLKKQLLTNQSNIPERY